MLNYLSGYVAEQEHLVAGSVCYCTQLPVTRVDVVRELVRRLACQDVLGGNVKSEPVEHVHLLSLRRVDLVLTVRCRLRNARYHRSDPAKLTKLLYFRRIFVKKVRNNDKELQGA